MVVLLLLLLAVRDCITLWKPWTGLCFRRQGLTRDDEVYDRNVDSDDGKCKGWERLDQEETVKRQQDLMLFLHFYEKILAKLHPLSCELLVQCPRAHKTG